MVGVRLDNVADFLERLVAVAALVPAERPVRHHVGAADKFGVLRNDIRRRRALKDVSAKRGKVEGAYHEKVEVEDAADDVVGEAVLVQRNVHTVAVKQKLKKGYEKAQKPI